jgi:hypothetical protein
MRAILYRVLRKKIVLLAAPDTLTSTMALQKAASNAVEAAARVLDDPEGLALSCQPSKPLVHTSTSGRPYLE